MDIRLRLGERPSWSRSGGDDSGTRDESNSMGSGRDRRVWFHAVGEAGGEHPSGETGELSSMMSWVERFRGTLALLMTRAGVEKASPPWDADGLGVEAANRGVA